MPARRFAPVLQRQPSDGEERLLCRTGRPTWWPEAGPPPDALDLQAQAQARPARTGRRLGAVFGSRIRGAHLFRLPCVRTAFREVAGMASAEFRQHRGRSKLSLPDRVNLASTWVRWGHWMTLGYSIASPMHENAFIIFSLAKSQQKLM